MTSARLKGFALPATLAVTTFFSLGSCVADPSNPSNPSNPSGNDDDIDPTTVEFCEDVVLIADCEAIAGCGWSNADGECVNTCFEFETQDECEAAGRCEWFPDGTSGGGSETSGTAGACNQPFT